MPSIDNSKFKSTTSCIDVDGIVRSGKDWAKALNFGENLINTYIRKYGEENTKEFIRRRMSNPDVKLERLESYYDYYMT